MILMADHRQSLIKCQWWCFSSGSKWVLMEEMWTVFTGDHRSTTPQGPFHQTHSTLRLSQQKIILFSLSIIDVLTPTVRHLQPTAYAHSSLHSLPNITFVFCTDAQINLMSGDYLLTISGEEQLASWRGYTVVVIESNLVFNSLRYNGHSNVPYLSTFRIDGTTKDFRSKTRPNLFSPRYLTKTSRWLCVLSACVSWAICSSRRTNASHCNRHA